MTYYFANEYHNAMDRGYEPGAEEKGILPPSAMGITTPPFVEQLEALKARIFAGASRVELGFLGVGKGSMKQGATTPEMYGREERQAIRELAKVNKVTLSVHAAPSAMGFSGYVQNQGFSDEAAEHNLIELKRAIDFAADTTNGGAVVAHTGEWHRPIFETVEKWGGAFEAYPEERRKGPIMLVDSDTGALVPIRRDMKIWEPVVKEWEIDPVTKKKVPKSYELNPDGTIKHVERGFDEVVAEVRREKPELTPEQAFVSRFFDAQRERAHAEAARFSKEAEEDMATLEKVRRWREHWEKIEAALPPEQKHAAMVEVASELKLPIPKEPKMMSQFLREQEEAARHAVNWKREAALAQTKEVHKIDDHIAKLRPIEEFGIKKTADTLARAAEFAREAEERRRAEGKPLKDPLFVAPENMFPEWGYGSHPQELKGIIQSARARYSEKLREAGWTREAAEAEAKARIKATFDIGHATTWRKFFKGTDEEFRSWLIDQVRDLTKHEIIGHLHVTDNLGYYDEHLTPGQGIAPIKEFLEEAKAKGIGSVIVEPAHQDYKAMLGAWEAFGSTIYSALAPIGLRDRWVDVQHSYFGRTVTPNYIVGEIRPSEDWTLWSGMPLE